MKRAVIALALLLTGCPAKTPIVVPTADPSPSGSVAPSPEPSPSTKAAPVAVRAAYVEGDGLFLYDVAKDSVQQILAGGGMRQPRFMNRDTIAFLRDEGTGTAVIAYDVRTQSLTTLHTSNAPIGAWSPRSDNEEIAYVATDQNAYPQLRYRALVGNASTLVVTTLARAFGREADLSEQTLVRWSPDARRTLMVFTPADGEGDPVPDSAAQLQVRGADGRLEFAPPQAQQATQAAMSPDGRKVYYRSSAGTRMWDAATRATAAVPGRPPIWFNPTVSIDGRALAYDTGATSAKVRVEVLDLRNGTRTQVGPTGRVHPVYATLRTLWTQSVAPCPAECLTDVTPGREVFATDLRNGNERKLALTSLQDLAVHYA
jgi:Tol biopolymer transport system component